MRIRFIAGCWLLLLLSLTARSQMATIKGTVTDRRTGQTLIGVNVILGEGTGASTDVAGQYEIETEPGQYFVTFKYVGYEPQVKKVNIKAGATVTLDAALLESSEKLDVVVVSASKYERKITEETVSVEVIKPDLITNTATSDLAGAVNKLASVTMMDNQVSIRGGSGYAFGAGSRVLLVIDDLPILTGDRTDIRFNFMPLEITEQVELVKGPSSAIYGAAALNGIISVRTAFPKNTPETKVRLYNTLYQKPKAKEQAWWGKSPPYQSGLFFSHMQKFGRLDAVVGGAGHWSKGYIRGMDQGLARGVAKVRYRPEKLKGLTVGLNGSYMYSKEADYFYWDSADSMYVPSKDATLYKARRTQVYLDPYVTYFDKKDNRHALKTRFYSIKINSSDSKPHGDIMMADYQFRRKFPRIFTLVAGANGQFFMVRSRRKDGLGNHDGNLGAFYGQLDADFGRLNAALGARWELFRIDNVSAAALPVGRLGLNYEASKSTFLRASFGQGYRFPGVAERFVNESAGSINVFPNPDLKPEHGLQTEVGVKQVVKISDWKASLDLAAFWTEYRDMTEFRFGIYVPEGGVPPGKTLLDYIGFKNENVSRARIMGYELTTYGEGSIGAVGMRLLAGYTYVYPVDLNVDTTLYDMGKFLDYFAQSIFEATTSDDEVLDPLLRYRYRHIFKGDVEAEYEGWRIGLDVRYFSFMEEVDAIFEQFIKGFKQYRKENNSGSKVFNMRVGYGLPNSSGNVTFVVNNVLNSLYTIRPARPEAPRNFTLQYDVNF